MSELNSLQIQGTITQPATVQKSESGVQYCSFSIVTNISKKQSDGKYANEPQFFPVALFGSYADHMEKYLTKGRRLIIEGYLRQTHWEKDGQKMSGIGIGVNKVHLFFERKDKGSNSGTQSENIEQVFQNEDYPKDSMDTMIYEEQAIY